jgi:hypothetical protein
VTFPAAAASILDWIIHPTAPAYFLDNHWEKKPHLVGRKDPAYFGELPGLDSVDELIVATASAATRPRDDGSLVRTGPDGTISQREFPIGADGLPDIHSVYRAYSDGYSIVLNRVHRRSAVVTLLCQRLEGQLHHRVGANLYLTPRGAQGFRRHVDDHDVLVLQLHGVKEWIVTSPSEAEPSQRETSDKFTLRKGDTLYIPRGFPHEAVTTQSSSLHLTVGIHAFAWGDLLVEALKLAAEDEPVMTSALPPGFLDQTVNGQIAELAQQLAKAVTDPALVERAKSRLGERLIAARGVPTAGHFHSIDAALGVTTESAVGCAPGMRCLVRVTSSEAIIQFGDNHVSGPSWIAPALRFIAGAGEFVVGDLPGELSPTDKVDLVTRLISEGLLNVIEPARNRGGAHV